MEKKKTQALANDFAPRDGKLQVYVKKVAATKSDGFAVVQDGQVFVIDGGGTKDEEMKNILRDLRERWLEACPAEQRDELPLGVHCIVSHSHADHRGTFRFLFEEGFVRILSFYAPCRAALTVLTPERLPSLNVQEDKLDEILARAKDFGLTDETTHRIPYGKSVHIPFGKDASLTIFTSPFDWSEERESEDEGIRFLMKYISPTYRDCPEEGYTNGILNGNSLWVKIQKGERSVLITGDQRTCPEMSGAMVRYWGEEKLRCDVLKLLHHGDSRLCPELMAATQPSATIFTAPKGLALEEVLKHCHELGAVYEAYRGNIVLEIFQNEIRPLP